MKITINMVAVAMHKDPSWIRAGIITGYLPIGVATRKGKQITSIDQLNGKYGRIQYYISEKLLYEFTGIRFK